MIKPINHTEFEFLRWAVDQAETWRGSMTGNPDPAPLENFDYRIKRAREVLDKIGHLNAAYKALTKEQAP